MKEEFSRAFRFEVGAVAVAVGGDMKGVEPGFAVFDFAIGVGEITSTRAEGFNFGSRENDAGLDCFGNSEIVPGFPVLDFDRFQGA